MPKRDSTAAELAKEIEEKQTAHNAEMKELRAFHRCVVQREAREAKDGEEDTHGT